MKNILKSAVVMAALAGGAGSSFAVDDSDVFLKEGRETSREQYLDRAAKRFDRMDLDGDGVLTPEERRQFVSNLREKREELKEHKIRKLERAGKRGELTDAAD